MSSLLASISFLRTSSCRWSFGNCSALNRLQQITRQHGPITSPAFRGFQIFDLKDILFAGTTSYLMNRNSIGRLCDLYAAEVARGIRWPIDLFLRDAAQTGALRAGCLFPFAMSVCLHDVAETTTPGRYSDDAAVMSGNVLRHTFYIDCDWQRCHAILDRICQRKPLSEHQAIVSQVVDHQLFGEYVSF